MKQFTKTYEVKGARRMYECTEKNSKGERLEVEVSFCEGTGLPELWYKTGFTKQLISKYLHLSTWVYNEKGECYGGTCNPMIAEGFKIDPDWLLPTSEENEERLLEEVYRRFMNA